MDGTEGQRRPGSSRAPSRTSTTSSHSHRFHHNHCGSDSATISQPSTFLQEKIQQRRAEKKMSEGNMSTSTGRTRDGDNVIRSSPARQSAAAMVRRVQSNNSNEGELNSTGSNETDRAIETLKKQNWDMKLELYHRRERQTALEEQAKRLSEEAQRMSQETQRMSKEHAIMLAQSTETMKLYDDLTGELDRRDRAMFEAIDMIVDLQSRVDELEREKKMIRMVEADIPDPTAQDHLDGPTRSAMPALSASNSPSLRPVTDLAGRLGDPRTLERMSSFLSEHGERTVNLRDMILNNKSSFVHMRKISDMSAAPSEFNRLASPSLSVLSESSFMSVYGNTARTPEQMPSPPSLEDPVVPDRIRMPDFSQGQSLGHSSSQGSSITRSHLLRDVSREDASLASQMQSFSDVLDISPSPQRTGRVEDKLSMNNSSRPSTSSHVNTAKPPMSRRARSQVRTQQEKREALRRVVTTSPKTTDFANARMLPPTPDTTSSSMLRRYHNSNDTLTKNSRGLPKDEIVHDIKALPTIALPPQISPQLAKGKFSHLAPVPVVTGQTDLLGPTMKTARANVEYYSEVQSQRPTSADETPMSRHRANSWGSESDTDGGADAHSEASDIDYWMHESVKPNVRVTDDGISSPDLFNFPTESGRWETDAILGAMRGTGFTPVPDLRRDPMDEQPTTLIIPHGGMYHAPDPRAPDGGIPPPVRRSSRSARTGSMTSTSNHPETGKSKKSLVRGSSVSHISKKTRSNSVDSASMRPPVVSLQSYIGDGTGDSKGNQYPPIAGQPTKLRKSGTLNRLFKRSIGSNQDMQEVPRSAAEANSSGKQMQSTHAHPRKDGPTGRSSVPPPATLPWRAPIAVFHDDLSSATPPPIMRKRGAPGGTSMDSSSQRPLTPRRVHSATPKMYQQDHGEAECLSNANTPQSGQSVRRKWLGLGRRSSLMNRNA
ncbi:hypothetical protein BKA67DRAFT_542586 [Truncatella angustata]|uniref:Centrosomin N-terminal motif 1 domain-containing protein n=1 Tax=Truncatella angustata TaxID=152316 RepID=A0A9P8RJQ7_9PEZI|nr:uncharacterized protein BKA67DRAFT_542586 [Truncatella angustata]KAH6640060.1 hypothetical protein BKA67DRAFT_542586 [Truncatella angustata]KAH8195740.1 hypothetical protein TruAng_010094 [Truncatella angustata]